MKSQRRFPPIWVLAASCIGLLNSAFAQSLEPEIRTHPRRAIALIGTSVRFDVTASSSTPLNYQWLSHGSVIPGATNSSLVLSNVTFAAATDYSVWVSNNFGIVTSTSARLDVFRRGGSVIGWGNYDNRPESTPPGLTNIVAIACGLRTSLALKGDGTVVGWGDPYGGVSNVPSGLSNVIAIAAGQWHGVALKRDGTVAVWGDGFNGQLDVPRGLSNVVAIAAAYFHTLALRSDGTVVGWGAKSSHPQFPYDFGQLTPPPGLNNLIGISTSYEYSLGIRADGSVVAWGATLTTNVPAGMTDIVQVAACNKGFALNRTGDVHAWTPYFRGNEASIVAQGSAAIAGIADSAIALQRDGTIRDLRQYTVSPLFRTLTNAWSVALAEDHGLTITDWPVIVTEPKDQGVTRGESATFSVQASGTGPLTYQWHKNGVALPNATNSTLILSNLRFADEGWVDVIVANTAGSVRSLRANLGVSGPPLILAQPTNQTVQACANASFSVAAEGYHEWSFPLIYQWRRNGTNLPGTDSPTLIIPKAQPGDAGDYDVIVRNYPGTITSHTARLTVTNDLWRAFPKSELIWITGGDAAWFSQQRIAHRSVFSAQSGVITTNQTTWMETTVTGPGLVKYWWRTSSQRRHDQIQFLVGGVVRRRISGMNRWQQESVRIPAGLQTLRWSYSKDAAIDRGDDAGWVAEVNYRADLPNPPVAPLRCLPASANQQNHQIGFQLSVSGGDGSRPVIIYASTNLVDWLPIHTNQPGLGDFDYLDSTATNLPQRFYRAEPHP